LEPHKKKIKFKDEDIPTPSSSSQIASSRRKIASVESRVEEEERGNQFLEMKKQETKKRAEQEDELLEDMCNVVDRLTTISGDINKELGVQAKILGEIDEEIDDAQSSFAMLTKKMDAIINTEKHGFKIIVVLAIIVVLLIIIVFVLI